MDLATEVFLSELDNFNVEPLSHAILEEAENMLKLYGKHYGLRTLDALHLGCFSLLSENNWFFVFSDAILCNVAVQTAFNVINPLA